MEKEVFIKIKGFENYYISNLGRVLNEDTKKLLKLTIGTSGYYFVNLYKDKKQYNKMVHKLVFENFQQVKSNRKIVIDHINNNKLDNRLCNLQLTTNRINSCKDKKQKSGNYCIYYNSGSYLVRLRENGKKISLGTFKELSDAIKCRDDYFKKERIELFKNI